MLSGYHAVRIHYALRPAPAIVIFIAGSVAKGIHRGDQIAAVVVVFIALYILNIVARTINRKHPAGGSAIAISGHILPTGYSRAFSELNGQRL